MAGILANPCAGIQQPRLSKAIAAPASRGDWNHRCANHESLGQKTVVIFLIWQSLCQIKPSVNPGLNYLLFIELLPVRHGLYIVTNSL